MTKEEKLALKKELRKRTLQQNKALHKWFSLVGIELTMAGLPVQLVLKKTLDVDWDKEGRLVKELLWRRAQMVVLGKTSTTELEKIGDIDLVYDTLNRFLGEKFGIHVPFPTENHDPQTPKK